LGRRVGLVSQLVVISGLRDFEEEWLDIDAFKDVCVCSYFDLNTYFSSWMYTREPLLPTTHYFHTTPFSQVEGR
jgi:hypothetical protein